MKYVLNSAVLTSAGVYIYKLIDVAKAKKWLEKGGFISTIGYQETADALELLTGIKVDVNRQQIKMKAWDEALVFRLTCRLEDVKQKGGLSVDFILKNCEVGLLKKLAEIID